jgi:hypothetical protein
MPSVTVFPGLSWMIAFSSVSAADRGAVDRHDDVAADLDLGDAVGERDRLARARSPARAAGEPLATVSTSAPYSRRGAARRATA